MKVNKPQSPLSIPEDLVIKRNQDELEFILPFEPGSKVILWIVTIVWNTSVVGVYIGACFGAFGPDFDKFILFGLFHLLFGAYFALYARAATYNTVHLKISREKIEKHEGPYYVPFNKRHYEKNWSEIKNIYVDQITFGSSSSTPYDRLMVDSHYNTDRLLRLSADNPHIRVMMSEIKSFMKRNKRFVDPRP